MIDILNKNFKEINERLYKLESKILIDKLECEDCGQSTAGNAEAKANGYDELCDQCFLDNR